MTATAVRNAFLKHAARVSITDTCVGVGCLDEFDKADYGYIVEPVITHWEDRATEWSGKRDHLEVQLIIFDVGTREQLSSSIVSGKSKWATFGGDHPQDLLETAISQYVNALYE